MPFFLSLHFHFHLKGWEAKILGKVWRDRVPSWDHQSHFTAALVQWEHLGPDLSQAWGCLLGANWSLHLRLVRSWAIRVVSVILPGFCWPLGFSDVISQMFAVPLLCLIWISCNWSVEILAAEEDTEEGPEEIHLCRNECAPFRPAWAVQMFYSSFSSPLCRFKQYQNTETPLLGLQTHHSFPRSTVQGGFFDASLISAQLVLLACLVMWEPGEPAWPRWGEAQRTHKQARAVMLLAPFQSCF